MMDMIIESNTQRKAGNIMICTISVDDSPHYEVSKSIYAIQWVLVYFLIKEVHQNKF